MRELTNEETRLVSGGNRNAAIIFNHFLLPQGGLIKPNIAHHTATSAAINSVDIKQQLGPETS